MISRQIALCIAMGVAPSAWSRRTDRWRASLRRLWRLARRLPSEQQFLEGEPIHCHGLLFLLDPTDDTVIHIAVPLDEFDRREIPEMVQEAREIFAEFASERPALETLAKPRALLVRIVVSYEHFQEEVAPRVRLENWYQVD